jgi:hypothetical protein
VLKARILIVTAILFGVTMTALSSLAPRTSTAKTDAGMPGRGTPQRCADQAWPYFSSDCLKRTDGPTKESRRVRIIADPTAPAREPMRPAPAPKALPRAEVALPATIPAAAPADLSAPRQDNPGPPATARKRPPNGLPPVKMIQRSR